MSLSQFITPSHDRLLLERDKLKRDIDRLEQTMRDDYGEFVDLGDINLDKNDARLKSPPTFQDMRRILIELRDQHARLTASIERALRAVDGARQFPHSLHLPSPNSGSLLVDDDPTASLVWRVNEVLKSSPISNYASVMLLNRDNEEEQRNTGSYDIRCPTSILGVSANESTMDLYENQPPFVSHNVTSSTADMSLASYEYLRKYNLLPKHLIGKQAMIQAPTKRSPLASRPENLDINADDQSRRRPFTPILDVDELKSLPKL